MLTRPWQTVKHICFNMIKTLCSLYSAELLMIDGEGELPPYCANRSLNSMIDRFLFPELHNKWIRAVIYYELFLMSFLMIGLIGFLVQSLLHKKYFLLNIQLFLLCGLFVGLSCICGFARLRLPIEPFFIIVASVFWIHFFSRKARE